MFREPDPQLGFLWGGLTMGMLLSLPLMLAGIAMMWARMRRQPATVDMMADRRAPLEAEIRRRIEARRSDRGGADTWSSA